MNHYVSGKIEYRSGNDTITANFLIVDVKSHTGCCLVASTSNEVIEKVMAAISADIDRKDNDAQARPMEMITAKDSS